MSTWWWIALVVVMLLALVATMVDGRGRSPRPPGRRERAGTRPGQPPRREGARGKPRPGEIWWANVPFEDGPGSKDRPCLVLEVRGSSARVAKITTKHHDERPGVIALPSDAVADERGRASFLETDELRDVRVREFRRRAGTVDAELWSRVQRLVG